MTMQEAIAVKERRSRECQQGNHVYIKVDENEKTCIHCRQFERADEKGRVQIGVAY